MDVDVDVDEEVAEGGLRPSNSDVNPSVVGFLMMFAMIEGERGWEDRECNGKDDDDGSVDEEDTDEEEEVGVNPCLEGIGGKDDDNSASSNCL